MELPANLHVEDDVWNSSIAGLFDGFVFAVNLLHSHVLVDQENRDGVVSLAVLDFAGYFSDVFASNTQIQRIEQENINDSLSSLKESLSDLREAVTLQQQRIDAARTWKAEHDQWVTDYQQWQERHDDGVLETVSKIWDWAPDEPAIPDICLGSQDPLKAAGKELSSHSTRQHPSHGAHYVAVERSSACPDDLDRFVTVTQDLNDEFAQHLTLMKDTYQNLKDSWKWGGADPVANFDAIASALDCYGADNKHDAEWIKVVSEAFRAAGNGQSIVSLSNAALNTALVACHTDFKSVNRSLLEIPTPAMAAMPPSSGLADDPVNTATGNFVESEVDLLGIGAAETLVFRRTYNSTCVVEGVCGLGWSTLAEVGLRFDDATVSWCRSDGREVIFPLHTDLTHPIRCQYENWWLTRVSTASTMHENACTSGASPLPTGCTWVVSDRTGEYHWFDGEGIWLGSTRGEGSAVFARRSGGLLMGVAHERGRFIELLYEGGRLVGVESSWGESVSYHYDTEGRLIQAESSQGVRGYEYDQVGYLARVINQMGEAEVVNTYDALGRIATQTSQFGRLSRYSYLPGRVTEVSDADGKRANTWLSDSFGRLLAVTDSHGNTQRMIYTSHGQLAVATDRGGAKTAYAYDKDGHETLRVLPSGGRIVTQWDAQGRPTQVATEEGASLVYEYVGECRNPSRIQHPSGGITQLEWNQGLLTGMTDPMGVVTQFSYDSFGDLRSVTDGEGHSWVLERDPAGRIVAVKSPLGRSVSVKRDASGRISAVSLPEGAKWALSWNKTNCLQQVTSPSGAFTRFDYQAGEDPSRVVASDSGALEWDFDDLGNVAGLHFSSGLNLQVSTDSLSRLRSIIGPDGGEWHQKWNAVGDPTFWVDPTGVHEYGLMPDPTRLRPAKGLPSSECTGEAAARQTQKDSYGRPAYVNAADGTRVQVVYDAAGNVAQTVDSGGNITGYEYDLAGRMTATITPEGRVTGYRYDRRGLLSQMINPDGGMTSFEYDAEGRLVKQVAPSGAVSWWTYDDAGYLVQMRPAGQGVTTYRYDGDGRIIRMQDPIHGVRTFTYDVAGHLTCVTNGLDGVTTYTYDRAGYRVGMSDPLGNNWSWTRDVWGRVKATKDPLGRVTRFTYDQAGRLVGREDHGGHKLEWAYNQEGRLSETRQDRHTIASIHYEQDGQEVTVRDCTHPDALSVTHHFTYNQRRQLVGRVTRVGQQTDTWEWSYDGDGLLVQSSLNNQAITYEYDQAGRLATITDPFGTQARISTNSDGRITALTTDFLRRSWAYENGYLTEKQETLADYTSNESYKYDTFGRLVGLDRNAGSIYDSVRTDTDSNGVDKSSFFRQSWTFDYNQANCLTRMTEADRSLDYRYDRAGRLTSISDHTDKGMSDEATYAASYDQASQLLTWSTAHARTAFKYDSCGRRTHTILTGNEAEATSCTISWDQRSWPKLITQNSAQRKQIPVDVWVNALGEPAVVGGVPLAWDVHASAPSLVGAGSRRYWHLPGGTLTTSDNLGGKVDTRAQGMSLPPGVSTENGALKVAGYSWWGMRLADPATFSFLTPDPALPEPGALWEANTYNLLGNNPLNLIDPWGTKPVTDDFINEYNTYRTHANPVAGFFDRAQHNFFSWNTLGAALLIVGGAALTFTGVGGPVGVALIGAGIDAGIQQLNGGSVDWVGVAISGFAGVIVGPAAVRVGEIAGSLPKVGKYLTRGLIASESAINQLSTKSTVARVGVRLAKDMASDGAAGALTWEANEVLGRRNEYSNPLTAFAGQAVSPENRVTSLAGHGLERAGRYRYGSLYDVQPLAFGNEGFDQTFNEFFKHGNQSRDPWTGGTDPDRIYSSDRSLLHQEGGLRKESMSFPESEHQVVQYESSRYVDRETKTIVRRQLVVPMPGGAED